MSAGLSGNIYGGMSEFPNPNIKDSEKDEAFHKSYVQSITSRSLDASYDIGYYSMNESYNFYQGLQASDDFDFLQTAEDGDVLPAQWLNFNKIGTKVNLMLGELASKGYDFTVSSINRDAKIRKFRTKEDSRVDMRMQPSIQGLEEQSGLNLTGEDFIPANEIELDEYYNYNYKEKSEIVMHYMLRDILKRSNWDYMRISLFRDIVIAGICVTKNEIVNGIPITRRVDPRNFIFDRSMQDDLGTDCTFYGEIRYMSFSELASKYGLKKEELNNVYKSYGEYRSRGMGTLNEESSKSFADFTPFNNSSEVFPFKKMDGELRAIVVTAVWKDYRDITYKNSVDKHGNTHIKKMTAYSRKRKDEGKIDKVNLEIWRQGTLIAGKIMVDWGEIKNEDRPVDNIATTSSPYSILVPNYVNGIIVSKVDELKGLQKLKDILMFNIQLTMARAGAKGFVYDTAQIPDDWDVHNVIKYLKTTGIAFINSANAAESGGGFNQFTPIDMTLSNAVTQYIALSQLIDGEMSSISGINEAREGIAQPYQKTGVNQSSLIQSNLTTETYYRFFSMFSERVFNHLAGLGKIAYADKKKFSYIIGDAGVDFLKEDISLDLNDYAIEIKEIPESLNNSAKFQEIVTAALQAGQIDFISAIKLMRETDITQGVIRLERDIAKKAQEAQEAQAAMEAKAIQAQQQAEQQKQQMEIQAAEAEAKFRAQADKEAEQIKARSDYARDKLKVEGKTRQDNTKHKVSLAEKKMDLISKSNINKTTK